MIDTRPIVQVKFKTTTFIGYETLEWSADRPHYGFNAALIRPRSGDPDRGEPRDSIIFEIRVGDPSKYVDVEVPRGNIAQIIRSVVEAKPAPAVKK